MREAIPWLLLGFATGLLSLLTLTRRHPWVVGVIVIPAATAAYVGAFVWATSNVDLRLWLALAPLATAVALLVARIGLAQVAAAAAAAACTAVGFFALGSITLFLLTYRG